MKKSLRIIGALAVLALGAFSITTVSAHDRTFTQICLIFPEELGGESIAIGDERVPYLLLHVQEWAVASVNGSGASGSVTIAWDVKEGTEPQTCAD